MDAFAMGAYVATLNLVRRKNDLRNFLLISGFTLAAGGVNLLAMSRGQKVDLRSFGFAINSVANYQHIWGFTLLDVSSAACILAVVNGNWLTRIFEGRLLAYMGKISYGMYVYHQPILWFMRNYSLLRRGVIYFAFYFTVLLAVSHVSFEYFETWFLNLKERAFKAG
jgi:peptidoglycan/LPS O-acetylase OafA/YrhL